MTYGESNGHVTLNGKTRDPIAIRSESNISKTAEDAI